jgi:hypothetical protein
VKRKITLILVTVVLLIGLVLVPAQAANEADIEQAIIDGLVWLTAQQNMNPLDPDYGSWNAYYGQLGAGTGLALYKLCERAYELNYESPFDPAYEYSGNVSAGFTWMFNHLTAVEISVQDHTAGATGTMDDPDSRVNGLGVRTSTGYQIYTTGIMLAAIAASGTPDRPNEGGMDVDGDAVIDTYQEIAQDIVDFLAFAQSDGINAGFHGYTLEGGWEYQAIDNGNPAGGWMSDQSNSGYAMLGLAEAQAFGCTIPDWVKTELSWWIDWVQDDVDNDPPAGNDGGSLYSYPGDFIGVNILKTGNLIFQMALAGDTPTTPRVQDALDYLERHWADASGANSPAGWDGNPAQYQAMFCAMKGLEYMGIDTFGAGPIDWFEDFSDAIVAQQDKTAGPTYGSWQNSSGRGEPVIITEWALLTLEKVAPPPTCPEEPGTRTMGFYKNHPCVVELVLPVTIAGEEVTEVDRAIEIMKDRGTHQSRLLSQLMVTNLNVAVFGIGGCTLEKLGLEGDETVNEVMAQAEELLADPDATKDELSAKQDELDKINNSNTNVPLPEDIAEKCPPGGGPPKTPSGRGKN